MMFMKNKLTNMKKLIIFLMVFAAAGAVKAQTKTKVNKTVKGPTYYSASSTNAILHLALIVDTNTKWIDYSNQLPNQPLDNYVFLHGTKKAAIEVFLSKYKDPKYYRYNIIQNDSIYLATNASLGTEPYSILSGFRETVQLGWFDVENKKLTIETYNINQKNKVSTTTIYNKAFKPAKISMTSLWVTSKNGSGVTMENLKDGFNLKINDGHRTVTGIQLAIKQTDLTFIYHVFVKNLATGKSLLVSNEWLYNNLIVDREITPYLHINASFFSEPGEYEIVITPQLPKVNQPQATLGKATTLRFTVLKSDTVYSGKIILFIALAVIFIAAIAIFYSRRVNRMKLVEQQQQKDLAQVQLSAVRSQLNPHFLFNALAGIQNLMNKNEVDQANRYLSKFARLTRNVLKSNELINITDETALLEDYLQMEQLRFGFTYLIEIDKSIDADNTEIPAMLLQPFVENAVKHGIADKGDEGKINIKITKRTNSLLLSITDNGNGFDINTKKDGLGIPLSQRRVTLLNQVYKQAPVLLDIKSASSGTEITITLTQWL
jgi:two-component system LytT family sensor kinase